jgi:hypothetical protein
MNQAALLLPRAKGRWATDSSFRITEDFWFFEMIVIHDHPLKAVYTILWKISNTTCILYIDGSL